MIVACYGLIESQRLSAEERISTQSCGILGSSQNVDVFGLLKKVEKGVALPKGTIIKRTAASVFSTQPCEVPKIVDHEMLFRNHCHFQNSPSADMQS